MTQNFKRTKQVPARISEETYNKFVNIVDRMGRTQQHVLKNLIESFVAEYEAIPTDTFRVVRENVTTAPRVDL